MLVRPRLPASAESRRVPVGRRVYEGWGSAEPLGADAVTWHLRYRVLEGGVPVAEYAVDYRWRIVSPSGPHVEVAEHGFTARLIDDDVFAISIENDNRSV